MDKINLWCKLAVTVSVISSVTTLIIHDGSMKKAFCTLMSIIMVFSLIYPLSGSKTVFLSLADSVGSSDNTEAESEISDYSKEVMIYAVKSEVTAYIKDLVGECICEVVCTCVGDKVHIDSISIEGEYDDGECDKYYSEIKKICTDGTIIEINGERYGRKE